MTEPVKILNEVQAFHHGVIDQDKAVAQVSVLDDKPSVVMNHNGNQQTFNSESVVMNNSAALGGLRTLDTLTSISRDVIQENYFEEENISKLLLFDTGAVPFAQTMKHFRVANNNYDGNTGWVSTNASGQIDSVDYSISDSESKRSFWAVSASHPFFDQKQAELATSGYVRDMQQKMLSMKESYDRAVERAVFVGCPNITGSTGVLNSANMTVNTTLINKAGGLVGMTDTEFDTFRKNLITTFQTASLISTNPNRFYIPLGQYTGLASMQYVAVTGSSFSRLDVLKETLAQFGGEVHYLKYLNKADNNIIGVNKEVYILAKQGTSINNSAFYFDLPIPFTMYNNSDIRGFSSYTYAYAQIGEVFVRNAQNVVRFENPSA